MANQAGRELNILTKRDINYHFAPARIEIKVALCVINDIIATVAVYVSSASANQVKKNEIYSGESIEAASRNVR